MTSPYAPAIDPAVQKLRKVRDLASLVTYLHEELEWPVAEIDFENLVYDVTPQEAGLDAATEAKVRSIKRLRPLSNDQPWGIFFIDFVPGDLPITVLRRILRAVSIKKREQGRADRKAWQTDDLLFISVLGEEGDRDLNLAHFNEDPAAKRATLRVVEWDAQDTAFAILRTHNELRNLAWRREGESDDQWRDRWAKAFALRPREVAQTAKALASQMAHLAKLIRERVNEAIKVESKDGPLRQLHEAFKEVLLHDLTEDGFADMYAQTMTYGLFAARQSRPMGITLDNAVDMIPNTNPFLRDLLAQFTTAAGLTHALDFDELGVDALIETLNRANMEAVVADFGREKPDEDPVIHFYEDFLREYNKKQKIQRGVFYTPKPVVSFIVRSVHELLQTEFQLPDGLASTETWSDMVAKFPELKIPEGATPETPFVQVLDPACGTGTFLVEVIQLIHDTMAAKWQKHGIKHGSFEWQQAWNEYVAKHLLPRIYGFEIMMASYTIAHMKVGLKLSELGYKFAAAERLRIYLTNTLEPPQDFRGMFDIMAPALAHEARAVNEVKANTRFTVVVGNPPYSNFGRSNRNNWILGLLAEYKRGLNEKKLNLDDDFIKFVRYSHVQLLASGHGVIGLISNNVYLDGVGHRRMRQSLLEQFDRVCIVDLHGNAKRRDRARDGTKDESVFDITIGVAIGIFARPPARGSSRVSRTDVWGLRSEKYAFLDTHSIVDAEPFTPVGPAFYLTSRGDVSRPEYLAGVPLNEVFELFSSGIQTKRDAVAIAESKESLLAVLRDFAELPPFALAAKYGLPPDGRDWQLAWASAHARAVLADERAITKVLYRPFDVRWTVIDDKSKGFVAYPRYDVMSQMIHGNIALVCTRQLSLPTFQHAFASRHAIDGNMISLQTREYSYLFPLYTFGHAPNTLVPAAELDATCNLTTPFLQHFRACVGAPESKSDSETAERIFEYIYALLHSPTYRQIYSERLKSDFPRVLFPGGRQLWSDLALLGAELLRRHLLEPAVTADDRKVQFSGVSRSVVAPGWNQGCVRLDRRRESLDGGEFTGVPSSAWTFELGGYQPAQKWLKDRRGRVLTDEDIEHYKRIIGAIEETIRIQKEIDEVIEAHGGWPAAFQGGEAE